MHWHGGEQSGADRRGHARARPDTSPDIKGVFGEGASVVAVAPVVPQPSAADRGADALAHLFNVDPSAGLTASQLPPRKVVRSESRGLWKTAPEPSSSTSHMRPAVLPRAVLGRSLPLPPTAAERAPTNPELRADATAAHTAPSATPAREPVTVTHDFDNESTTLYQRDDEQAPQVISARTEAEASGDGVITARPEAGADGEPVNEVITARPEADASAEPAPAAPTPSRSGRPSARAQRPSRASSPLFAANQAADSSPSPREAHRTFDPVPSSLESPQLSANDNAASAPTALDLERLADAELAQAPSAAAPSASAKPRPRARARAGQAPAAPTRRSLPQWTRFAIALAAIAFGLIMFSVGVSMGVLRLPPKPAPASPPPSAAMPRPTPPAHEPALQPSAEPAAPAEQPAAAAPPSAPTPQPSAATAPTPAEPPSAPTPQPSAATAPTLTAPPSAPTPQPSAATMSATEAAPKPKLREPTPAAAPTTPELAPPPSAASPGSEASAPVQPTSPQPSAATDVIDPARVVAQAWAQLRAKNPAAAEALLRPMLARDPDDHHAAEALAQALLEQSKAREALRYIEQIVRKRPKRAAYRILLGDAKQALSDQDGAIAAWQAALQMEPDNREAKRRLHLE